MTVNGTTNQTQCRWQYDNGHDKYFLHPKQNKKLNKKDGMIMTINGSANETNGDNKIIIV